MPMAIWPTDLDEAYPWEELDSAAPINGDGHDPECVSPDCEGECVRITEPHLLDPPDHLEQRLLSHATLADAAHDASVSSDRDPPDDPDDEAWPF